MKYILVRIGTCAEIFRQKPSAMLSAATLFRAVPHVETAMRFWHTGAPLCRRVLLLPLSSRGGLETAAADAPGAPTSAAAAASRRVVFVAHRPFFFFSAVGQIRALSTTSSSSSSSSLPPHPAADLAGLAPFTFGGHAIEKLNYPNNLTDWLKTSDSEDSRWL